MSANTRFFFGRNRMGKANLSGELTVGTYVTVGTYLQIGSYMDLVESEAPDPAKGRIYWDGTNFKGCTDGTNWTDFTLS